MGSVSKYKARLVVRGYLQGEVENTYAPVVDFTIVRIALTLAVQRGYVIHQMDAATAFLHGDVDEDIYVIPPEDTQICNASQVLKLNRGLYGLKQAPRLWNDKWRSAMFTLGFSSCMSDECVFRKGRTWMLLYVDDIIILGPDDKSVADVKSELQGPLDVKDLGKLNYFLGVSFRTDSDGAWLNQSHYVEQLLSRFGMDSCKPVNTPMCLPSVLDATDEADEVAP